MTGVPATTWAGPVTFHAGRRQLPASLDELREVVARADRVHVVGAGHSFTPVADTTGDLVSLAGLPPRCDVSADGRRVTVSAGSRYAELAPRLHQRGLALANLASVPHVTVAGAVATGTHGSGVLNRALSAAGTALELVTGHGSLLTLRRGDPDFAGAVVSLGALGAVTALELEVEPTYDVRQVVHDDVPVADVLGDLDGVLGSAYSVSAFTTLGREPRFQVWRKLRADDDLAAWSGGRPADGARHPIPGLDPRACTTQLGEPGPWHERLPHFRADAVPSAGAERQSEWLVPRSSGPDAVAAFLEAGRTIGELVLVAEVRAVAADDLWLSMAHGRDSVGLHLTWRPDDDAVRRAVALVQDALAPYDPRPHWAKVSAGAPADVLAGYPRGRDFADLRHRLDPRGAFRNELVDALL